MDYMTGTKELLAQYELVCKEQRESAVRNSALLHDVDRIQRLLTQTKPQRQLQALKIRYQQYVASVYPQWVAQLKSCVRSTDATADAALRPSKVESFEPKKPLYSAAANAQHKPVTAHIGPLSVVTEGSKVPQQSPPVVTENGSDSVNQMSPPLSATSPTANQQHTEHSSMLPTTVSVSTVTAPAEHLGPIVTCTETIVTCSAITTTHVKAITTSAATQALTENTPVLTEPNAFPTTRQPDSLTVPSPPVDKSLDLTLSTYSISTEDSARNISTVEEPVNISPTHSPVPLQSSSSHSVPIQHSPVMSPQHSTPSQHHSPTLSHHSSVLSQPSSHHSSVPPQHSSYHSPTLSQHSFSHHSSVSTHSPMPSQSPSHTPPHACSTPPKHSSTPSHSVEVLDHSPPHSQQDSVPPSLSNSSLGSPSQHHSSASTQHDFSHTRTPSPPPLSVHSSPTPSRSGSPVIKLQSHQDVSALSPPPTPVRTSSLPPLTPSPPHPPPTPVRTSSLPPITPSPPHPPPTPVRTSSLPPLTPSPPHSLSQDSLSDSFCPDRVKVVTNLLKTLNSHLRAEQEAAAMQMYSEPEASDKMKLKISNSSVLSTNIIKAADSELDCSTWDPSVVSVVFLHQLSLLSTSQGSPISDELLGKDTPIITRPFDVSPSWLQVWTVFMEHIYLLASSNRPLDELAAIFTPALVTTATEKACLQLLAHFKLTMDPDSVEGVGLKDGALGEEERLLLSEDVSEDLSEDPVSLPILSSQDQQPPTSYERGGGLLDFSALGGGDLSEHSSLLSEGSAVMRLERELKNDDSAQPVTSQPKDLTLSVSRGTPTESDQSSVATTPGYVPTAVENSAPPGPSQLSNNSSLRRRLGFFDDSDSDIEEASNLLSPRQPALEEDFDFYG